MTIKKTYTDRLENIKNQKKYTYIYNLQYHKILNFTKIKILQNFITHRISIPIK